MKKRICCITIALCTVLCIVFTAGCSKTAKSNTILPEVRNNGTAIQWKYSDETDWRDLVALAELRGASGENGKNGVDGSNGTNGKDGINGTDGKDGINGTDGKNGLDGKDGINGTDGKDGTNGKDGINAKNIEVQRAESYIQWRYEGDEWQNLVAIADITGPAGQNGACSGYFYAETRIPRVFLNNGNAALSVYEKVNSGDLISTYLDKITLKKGHVYSVTISGSLQVVSNESNNSGNYSIQMTDGYDDDLCREVTRIKRDGKKIAQTNDQHSFNFTRIYDASDEDITLYFMFEQSAYNTRLESFKGTITITALD